MKRFWQRLISWASSDLGLKIFSLVFAVGLWLFVNVGQKPAEQPFKVPVAFRNVPGDVMVANPGLDHIEVRLMGPPALLSTVDPEQLKVVLDLDGERPGTSTFRLGADFFNPPRGVRITRISPSVINVRLDSVATRSLPVSVRFVGRPPFGYKVSRVEASPESVEVRGPAGEVSRMTGVETLPVELDGTRSEVAREVRLNSSGKLLSFFPNRVAVSVELEEESMTREFSRLEVKARDFKGDYSVSPERVWLKLRGPKRVLAKLSLGTKQVHLDLKGLGPGSHKLALRFDLPREVEILEQKPDRFTVTIPSPSA